MEKGGFNNRALPSSASNISAVSTSEESEFRPEFKKLVQEAYDQRLDDIVSKTIPSRELTAVEESICKKFICYQRRHRNFPWGLVLQGECRERNIFGSEYVNLEQLIPIALSRILKAEGADINELLSRSGMPNAKWYTSNTNISLIFSQILGKTVKVDLYQMVPCIIWLTLNYHEKFSHKRGILLKECEEELIAQRIGKEDPDTSSNLKRKIDSITNNEEYEAKKAKKEINIPYVPVSTMTPPPAPIYLPIKRNVVTTSSNNTTIQATLASNNNNSSMSFTSHMTFPTTVSLTRPPPPVYLPQPAPTLPAPTPFSSNTNTLQQRPPLPVPIISPHVPQRDTTDTSKIFLPRRPKLPTTNHDQQKY